MTPTAIVTNFWIQDAMLVSFARDLPTKILPDLVKYPAFYFNAHHTQNKLHNIILMWLCKIAKEMILIIADLFQPSSKTET